MAEDTLTHSPDIERFAHQLRALGSDPRRARAFEAFEAAGLPHRRVEGWRWSDVRAALKGLSHAEAEVLPADPLDGLTEARFVFDDQGYTPPAQRPAGVEIIATNDAQPFAAAEQLPMAALAAALSAKPAMVLIDIAASPVEPLHLVLKGLADRYHNIVVRLREGVEATVLESCVSAGGLADSVIDYQLDKGAKLHRLIMQTGAPSAVQVHTAKVSLMQSAELHQTAFATGGRLCRIETRVSHERAEAKAVLNGAYLLSAGYHCDYTSLVLHSEPNCQTQQVVKGAAMAGGKGAFQGKFHVKRGAQKTDADMQHNALLLEDGAEINAKPELEIYADDVACAHGNTCGALDEDQLFYMRQRGIPEVQARALLTESFIAEAFDDIADEAIRERFLEAARSWLQGGAA